MAGELIILFDGDCGLCSRSARWLARRDRSHRLILAPNAGATARILGEPPGGEQAGIVAWDGARRLVGVPALARALRELGGIWRLAGAILAALPCWLTHPPYALVARHRRLGQPSCELRGPVGEGRFVD